jgi:hypothetical protein
MAEDEELELSAQPIAMISNAELDRLIAELGTHPLAEGELWHHYLENANTNQPLHPRTRSEKGKWRSANALGKPPNARRETGWIVD